MAGEASRRADEVFGPTNAGNHVGNDSDDVFGVYLAAELQRTIQAKTAWLMSVGFNSDDPRGRAMCEWLMWHATKFV